MTSLGPGRDTYLKETAASISEAAKYSPLPVQWLISYPADAFCGDDLHYTENIVCVETTHIPISGPVNAATGRNHAIMHAEKHAVMVNCDSDDLFTPERFQLIDIDNHDTISVCAADDVIDGEVVPYGPIRGGVYSYPWWEDAIEGDDDITPRFKYHLATLSIPRDIAIRAGGYPALDYMEDTVFAKMIHDKCKTDLSVYPEVGYLYRKHANQSSRRAYDKAKIWETWIDP